MINWNRYSLDQIEKKWDHFQIIRKKKHDMLNSNDKEHITCLERENLIANLLFRLNQANSCIDSFKSFKEIIER